MVNSSLYNTLFSKKNNSKQNKYQKGGSDILNILYEKKEFLVKTFANLIVQLGITYYVMEKTPATKNKTHNNNIMYLYLFGGIAIIIIMALVPMPSWLKFVLFCLFSCLSGLLLSLVKLFADNEVINMAILGTISIFAVMFAFGMGLIAFGIKLGFRTFLFLLLSLLLLIILRIVFSMSGATSTTNKMLTFFGLFIFSIYIIYDTNKILQRNYYDDFITASLDYYLDILNIFVNLLSLGNN